MSTATIVRPEPGTLPNGLPWKPYTYQGLGYDALTPELDEADGEAPAGRELKSHGTAAAARRHYRRKTPLCEECEQFEKRRREDEVARNIASGKTVRAVHAGNGGRPRCGVWNIADPVIAAPGQPITCKRCNNARGGTR